MRRRLDLMWDDHFNTMAFTQRRVWMHIRFGRRLRPWYPLPIIQYPPLLSRMIAAAVRRGRQEYWETIGERVLKGNPRAPKPRGITKRGRR